MDKTDKLIQELLNKDIDIPEHFDNAIKTAFYTEKGKSAILEYKKHLYKRKHLRKIAASIIISLSSVTTICAAGFAYDRVWYEPETYSAQDVQNALNSEVSKETKTSLISENDARLIALDTLSNLGYSENIITSIELKNDISDIDNADYIVQAKTNLSDEIYIKVNGKNGDILDFKDENFTKLFNYNSLDNISESQALLFADDIMSIFNYNKDDYLFSDLTNETTYISNVAYSLWHVTYYKVYSGIYNPYEKIDISFVVSGNKPFIYEMFVLESGNFEDDLINVSQMEAIRIAVNKEKEFTENEISRVEAELGIRKINTYFEYLSKPYIDYSNQLTITNTSRKVWIISIKHKKTISNNSNDSLILRQKDKSYFIDCTNGKILGGQPILNSYQN